ncbi:glycosyltransferase family 4 protein [Salinimonas sp. HHU 13199]|uniref:Glycosyltransferase family 4 protein n=1 Tax=Salinimonas profundi TaxID=2729140 RepID=A0ABR8LKA6_9ALTE|nr:glycosyltransferase family 4 protein [Salinimonas profundi]MBD3586630.1 glycosyltransferase family 4 protein [Salinimonas profundi]
MNNNFFQPFPETRDSDAVNVLTIAASFPSLIQPWLVNHLVQIIRHGGDNRIVSRREEKAVFTDAIVENNLLEKYWCVGDDKIELLRDYIKAMADKPLRQRTQQLMRNYNAKDRSVKMRIFDKLSSPVFACNPDIIHSHSEPAGARFIKLIQANKAPLVMTFHGLPPVGVAHITDAQRNEYTATAEAIFVNTEFAKQQYISLGAPEEKFIIVPQGIDLSRWPLQQRPFPENGTVNLLTVGRLHPDKGHRYALDAVKKLVDQGHDIQYTIVGSGPEKENIATKADGLGIGDRIRIHSAIPDKQLAEIYRQSHIFVLPSLRSKDGFHEETQGVVLQEAQATGLITIATRSGGIPECIDDGKSGYLVPDRDADALASAIDAVINKKDEWLNIQAAARQWVEHHYSADKIGDRMNAYYRDIIR